MNVESEEGGEKWRVRVGWAGSEVNEERTVRVEERSDRESDASLTHYIRAAGSEESGILHSLHYCLLPLVVVNLQ